MATNDNSQIEYESGQNAYAFEKMTDSGDRKKFTASASPWSDRSGFKVKVRPYGLLTPAAPVTVAASGSNDVVDVTALTAWMANVSGADAQGKVSVSAATDVSISRGVTTDTHRITSITVNSSGAIAAVAGVDHTAFATTRGDAGAPPLIPVGSIEIAQVRTTSVTAAAITAAEIFQVPGTHQERADDTYTIDYARGEITFDNALDTIHTGSVAKDVYVEFNTPIFSLKPLTNNWVPAMNSHSTSSTQYYESTRGSSSASLNDASFETGLNDGTTDAILTIADLPSWFRFKQDKNESAYQLTLGKPGFAISNPAGDHPSATVTISPTQKTEFFSS